eukprot:6397782-Alexandrium_andersonii.AAC.1
MSERPKHWKRVALRHGRPYWRASSPRKRVWSRARSGRSQSRDVSGFSSVTIQRLSQGEPH